MLSSIQKFNSNPLISISLIAIPLLAFPLSLTACNSSNQTATIDTTEQVEEIHNSPVSIDNDLSIDSHSNETNENVLQGINATVFKDANCGCCTEWISYANKAGLQSEVQHPENLSLIKDQYDIPKEMRSCHTAITREGYVFEGHIPAKFMAEFLSNPPSNAIGLAVPNMPVGSPGMEYNNQFMPYKVFQINKDGSYEVFASVNSPEQQG